MKGFGRKKSNLIFYDLILVLPNCCYETLNYLKYDLKYLQLCKLMFEDYYHRKIEGPIEFRSLHR